jgi:hypothetical protein
MESFRKIMKKILLIISGASLLCQFFTKSKRVIIIGFICSLYFLYWLACILKGKISQILYEKNSCSIEECKENLKSNWFMVVSVLSLLVLEVELTYINILGIMVAVFIAVMCLTQVNTINNIRETSLGIKILSAISAIGICINGIDVFCDCYIDEDTMKIAMITKVIGMIVAILAFAISFFLLTEFYKYLCNVFVDADFRSGLKRLELIIYTAIMLFFLVLVTWTFLHSDAFYSFGDTIYTSDAGIIVNGNAYLSLGHPENDLRQPLFAVFASPFIAPFYAVASLLPKSELIVPLFMDYIQVIMLVFTNFLLASILRLDSNKRICFMLIVDATYTVLLSSVMMEQYIVAYFWLILFIYIYSTTGKADKCALFGAGGTLLTGLFFAPLTSTSLQISSITKIRDFLSNLTSSNLSSKQSFVRASVKWLKDMIKIAVEFVVVLLAFGRYDVISGISSNIILLRKFTGEKLSFGNKLKQYIYFVRSCFLAPETNTDLGTWQLHKVDVYSVIGIIIWVLLIVSFIINRKKRITRISFCWSLFSFFVLCIVGWGTAENGLILYSLYFCWAYVVLIFQLIDNVVSRVNGRFVMPIIAVIICVGIFVFNMQGFARMVQFATQYYPTSFIK